MSRTIGLEDVRRCADLIDQTVSLLLTTNPSTGEECEILDGIASRLRIDADAIEEAMA